MNLERENYQPAEPEPTCAEAIADLWLDEALKNPMTSRLHDEAVVQQRSRLERRLPTPPDCGVNLIDAISEEAIRAGAVSSKRGAQ